MKGEYGDFREELRGWEVEELRRGLLLSLDCVSEDDWDEALTEVFLDALKEKAPPPQFSDGREAYERFRRRALDECGVVLPPWDGDK